MALAVFCVESAQGAAAFEGTLQVKRGGDGKVESAVLPAIAGKTSVDFHVVLDKSGLKMAEEAAGRAVKVKGSVSKKKKERWLTVKSFSLVLIGSAEVSRDDKRKMTSVVFTAEGWPSPFNVQIDSKAKLLAKGGGEKSFLVTGTLVELKEGEKVLKLETVFMLETLTGVVEVKETKKGKKTGATLVVENGKGKIHYLLILDAKGSEIMETLEDATLEVVGIATGRGTKRGLRVIQFKQA